MLPTEGKSVRREVPEVWMKRVKRPLEARCLIPSRTASTLGRWSAVAGEAYEHHLRMQSEEILTSMNHNIMLRRLLRNHLLIVQIPHHNLPARRLDLLAMFLSPHETSHGVSLANEQVQHIPADEARADNEDVLSRESHFIDQFFPR